MQQKPPRKPGPKARQKKACEASHIVGIGASAGGLEALELFLKNVSSGKGIAYVIVQHLLVDDEEYVISSLQRVVKMSGYRVVAVKGGMEALRLFGRAPDEFDLVITDLTMPEMTGVELARKLLSIRPDIPVILSTGFNDDITEQEVNGLGIRKLLLKPTGSGEVKRIVRGALEH